MSGLFDNPAHVVLRDQVMRKLILEQCRLSADPDAVLADWQAFLKRQHDLFVQLGLREGTTPDVSVDVLCGAIRDILRGTDHTLQ
jgi:hypothetical protein